MLRGLQDFLSIEARAQEFRNSANMQQSLSYSTEILETFLAMPSMKVMDLPQKLKDAS